MRINSRLLLLIAITLGVLAFWWQRNQTEKAKDELGLDATRIVTAVFVSQNTLKVATLRGEVLARSEATSGWWRIFRNEQRTRAPFTVDYFVDLGKMNSDAFRWNAADRALYVDLPAVTIARPSVDMSLAKVKQEGSYISRDSGIKLQAVAAQRMTAAAANSAREPDNLANANKAARKAVTDYVRRPLSAVGYGDVKVIVRLPGEALPLGIDREKWDVSRPIAEVLAEFR